MHVIQSIWTGKKPQREGGYVTMCRKSSPLKTQKCAQYHSSTDCISSNAALNVIGP